MKKQPCNKDFVIETKAKYKPEQSDASDSRARESHSTSSKRTMNTSKSFKAKGKKKKTKKVKNVITATSDNEVEKSIDELEKLSKQLVTEKGNATGKLTHRAIIPCLEEDFHNGNPLRGAEDAHEEDSTDSTGLLGTLLQCSLI